MEPSMSENKEQKKKSNFGISLNGSRIQIVGRSRRLTDDQKEEVRQEVSDATAVFLKNGGKIDKSNSLVVTSNSGNNPYELIFGGSWRT